LNTLTRGLLIGGKEIPATGRRTVADVSPWTGQPYAHVAAATPADVTAAVDAAATAFPAWSEVRAYERRAIFLRAADLLAARAEQAIATMAAEVGAARPWAGPGPHSTSAWPWKSCARPAPQSPSPPGRLSPPVPPAHTP